MTAKRQDAVFMVAKPAHTETALRRALGVRAARLSDEQVSRLFWSLPADEQARLMEAVEKSAKPPAEKRGK